MPILMSDPMLDENGKPIPNPKPIFDDSGKPIGMVEDHTNPLTVRQVLYRAISTPFPEDQAGDFADKRLTLFLVSQRVATSAEVDFTVEEAKLLLDRVAKAYNITVWGQIKQRLDPNGLPKLDA